MNQPDQSQQQINPEQNLNNLQDQISPNDQQKKQKKIFDKRHFRIVIPIVVIAGIVTGIGNFLKDLINQESDFYNFPKEMISMRIYIIPTYRVIFGIISASIIPLFLHFIHSDLLIIDETKDRNINNNKKALILFGFCVLSASFSDKFIDKMYKKSIEEQFENFKVLTEKKMSDKDKVIAPLIYKNQNKFDELILENDSVDRNREKIDSLKENKKMTPEEAEFYFYLYESGGVFKDYISEKEKFINSSKEIKSLIKSGKIIETMIGEKKVLVPNGGPIYE